MNARFSGKEGGDGPSPHETERGTNQELEAIIERLEKLSDAKSLESVERSETSEKEMDELYVFYAEFYDKNEMSDVIAMRAGIENGQLDNFVIRDEEGKIISSLTWQRMDLPKIEGKGKETAFIPWFVATRKGYSGRSLVPTLFAKALREFQESNKRDGAQAKALVGEADSETEGYFNRFSGAKRAYFENKEGDLVEVPFRSPSTEDDVEEGLPSSLMIKLLDGRKELTRGELLQFADAIYQEYNQPFYFTAEWVRGYIERAAEEKKLTFEEALTGEAGEYGLTYTLGTNPEEILERLAAEYHDEYTENISGLREKLDEQLGSAKDGKLILLGPQERSKIAAGGTKILENE